MMLHHLKNIYRNTGGQGLRYVALSRTLPLGKRLVENCLSLPWDTQPSCRVLGSELSSGERNPMVSALGFRHRRKESRSFNQA